MPHPLRRRVNLGDPVARKFLADFISQKIKVFGLGCYRQDFNMDPASFWNAADKPDRQGVTENKYIQVPLSSTSQDRAGDDYEFRSSMCSGLCLNWWVSGNVSAERIPENFPFAWARKTLDQYLTYREFYYGDYFPLTGYSQATDLWMAYQLDQPKSGRGMIVVLRRPESPYESARFNLRALEPQTDYRVTNLDTGEETDRSGRELTETGLEVRLQNRPSSALILYERKTTPGGRTQAK